MIFIKTNLFIPKRFDAYNYGFITLMRPSVWEDKGLREHERTHWVQFKRQPFTYAYKYHFNKEFRYEAELEAYANQLLHSKVYSIEARAAARMLSENYDLDKSYKECYKALTNYNLTQVR